MNFALGLVLALVGVMVMTPRFVTGVLESERRYGARWQQQAAGTPRRRKQARVMSVVVGACFIAGGVAAALGDA